jgi:hypothetical protein
MSVQVARYSLADEAMTDPAAALVTRFELKQEANPSDESFRGEMASKEAQAKRTVSFMQHSD